MQTRSPPFDRYRSRGGFLPHGTVPVEDFFHYNAATTQQVFTPSSIGEFEQMWDHVTPGFSTLSKQGAVYNSRMLHVKETRSLSYGSCTRTYIGSPPPYPTGATWKAVRNSNRFGWSCPTPVVDIERLKTLATTEALARANSGDASIGVALGELPQTMRMLRNPLEGVARFARGALSRPGSRARRTRQRLEDVVGGATSVHLMVIFGVLPIIRDIQAVLEILRTSAPERETFRGKANDEVSSEYTTPYSGGGATGIISGTCTRIVEVRAGLLMEWDIDSMLRRLGLLNPISTAYQLIPFSFIVDWFANLGKFLASLTPAYGGTSLAEWLTVTDFAVWQETLGPLTSIATDWEAVGGGDCWVRTIQTKSRTPVKLNEYTGVRMTGQSLSMFKLSALASLVLQYLTILSARH